MRTKDKHNAFPTPAIRRAILGLFLAAAALGHVACGSIDVDSRWRDFPIAIDGNSDDWGNALVPFEDTDVFLGVANDADSLFLCLDAGNGDRPVPFTTRGLVLWVDAKGGKSHDYGLRFPIGFDRNAVRDESVDSGDQAQGRTRRREARADARDELEIILPGEKEPRRVKLADLKGLEVSAKTINGRFVYEARIPLAASPDATFAVGAAPGTRKIGLGLELPESDSPYGRPGMGGRGGGFGGMGGMGGMRGGMDGRMGGRTGGRGGGLQNFKIWAYVNLAAAPGRVAAAAPSPSSTRRPD